MSQIVLQAYEFGIAALLVFYSIVLHVDVSGEDPTFCKIDDHGLKGT